MAQPKAYFLCSVCGHQSPKWLGRCPDCGSWNSLAETGAPAGRKKGGGATPPLSIASLADIAAADTRRHSSGIPELDILLGGGIVAGSAVLIGGEPGIGKSTLLLQLASAAGASRTILYISAEESLSQIKLRAERLQVNGDSIFLVAGGALDAIQASFEKIKPDIMIVDSIQTIHSSELPAAPGTLSQVRHCTGALIELTKTSGTALFLAGHVTKEGALAGPKTLEHMVDTVLYFEGSRDREIRLLRSFKNRFGNVNEVAVFLMQDRGLIEVQDPEGLFLEDHAAPPGPGAAITATLEGNRVLLAEIQALVTEESGNNAGRIVDGIEASRALRIKAIIDRYTGYGIGGNDVFLNVAGGLFIREPAVDLAIAIAMISSLRSVPVERKAVFFGELSLLGDLRRVPQAGKRILQVKKLGIPTIVLPGANKKECAGINDMELIFVDTLKEAASTLF